MTEFTVPHYLWFGAFIFPSSESGPVFPMPTKKKILHAHKS